MPKKFKTAVNLFDTEGERDMVFARRMERDIDVATGHRVIRKVTRREGNKTLYGIEVKRRGG